MVIDHIGIVVRSLEESLRQWEVLFGYHRNSDIALNTRQRVRVVFLAKKDSVTIKLIEAAGPDSPVAAMSRKGGGLHHLCFRCEDLKTQVSHLEAHGAVLMVAPQPGEAFKDHDIAFLMARNNLNVELIDTLEKKGWVSNPQNTFESGG
jgi:methylmalonyl-CoA/ethylmalonyl-CoA epimerase